MSDPALTAHLHYNTRRRRTRKGEHRADQASSSALTLMHGDPTTSKLNSFFRLFFVSRPPMSCGFVLLRFPRVAYRSNPVSVLFKSVPGARLFCVPFRVVMRCRERMLLLAVSCTCERRLDGKSVPLVFFLAERNCPGRIPRGQILNGVVRMKLPKQIDGIRRALTYVL